MTWRRGRKMRIAHIAPPWLAVPPKNYGGTENVIYNLIEEQVLQGHAVTLFAPGDAKTSARQIAFFSHSLSENSAPWDAHLKAYYHLHKSVAYLKKHKEDFDIVHTHLSSSSDMYLFPLTETLSIPQVTTLHSQFPFDKTTNGWQGDADRYYMEWFVKAPLIAISESARQQEEKKGFPLNIVAVIHHGMPVKNVVPQTIQPANFFVWLGRMVPEKGAHLAIEAAKKAGVPLVLAGIVDQHVPSALRYFHEQIEPQIDGQQIKYIGPVGSQDKIDLLSGARALLNPIQWEEPFGMVMVEAMAVGCPVIAFRRGAAPEIITSDKIGFLVNDVTEMVDRIQRIDEIDRKTVRLYTEEHFSSRAMAERYTKVYKRIIGQHLRQLVPFFSPPETTIPLVRIGTPAFPKEARSGRNGTLVGNSKQDE
jgi:glycosyltransferase involved in cell wall biosynthesis